ncbi:MAG: glutamine--fructose-6-phosphate transaminase (isomerizing), partial [Chloroflexi bacterium]|nr:glutamine--fructose-6-phosphate transaminase (isomerizing) [Chloroflexota bacterium]
MCGIVGYIGRRQAQPVLFNCLAKLEYRGYDSCGIALAGSNLKIYKDAVRVSELSRMPLLMNSTAGIGHTRWATHGGPSKINAHPHCDCTGNIAVVHNGIISNYQSLKDQLISEGHVFLSETDTEVISHLVEKYYQGNLEKAVQAALRELKGSYAVAVLAAKENKLVVARQDSPLIVGVGDRDNFIASDVPAVLEYTNRIIYLEDGDLGVMTGDSIDILSNGSKITREEHKILWSAEQAQKGGYEHFMLKEIHEQPKVIRDTFVEYARTSEPIAELERMRDTGTGSILMLACGTSYHAGLLGKSLIEELLRIPVRTELASEFNYYAQGLSAPLSIAITQSGETADTLKAIKRLKNMGSRVIAITNVVDSTASRLADQTLYTRAGPEISVAATKSFMGQLIVLYWLAMSHCKANVRELGATTQGLRQLPEKVQRVLDNKEAISEAAKYLSTFKDVFFVGRGVNYSAALEGALKLKEISYIHAEAYAAGELKHGPFALLGPDAPVIALVAQDNTYDAVLTNIKEIKARGSPVIAVAQEGDEGIEKLADSVITVPSCEPMYSPVINTVVLQLLAYYTARERKCPIDFPRNLAK